ncbi:trypsin-like peptidase domain-containing protein [Oxynema sp. CENA135]|uniref:S1 family peptidase n=1 Tax=Oxynema sp. CENA135 TaxID=984206 RepID=UPI00190B9CE7|nr:serine protease [Oxynema sp. CENA135]MBK4732981.1 trypsin-like peptidase domain-containing protein [Oxynema sp. CENA135]
MIFSSQLSASLAGTAVALIVTIPLMAAQALTKEQVDAVASQTTVVIAQGLQKGDIEARQEWNPGSGVIVARNGNTYYVVTALHVVRTREVVYGVRTSDGEVHFVDDTTMPDNIIPFGEEEGEFGETIDGFDLAIVKFTSDRDYPVAVMGDSAQMETGAQVYISGWPNPEDESARRTREFVEGQIRKIVNPPSTDGGYSLLYSNETRRGMSGGPVFNAEGELIGIHGRGRSQGEEFCVDPELSESNSCGIQSFHFVRQVEVEGLKLTFKAPPVDPDTIAAGMENRERADTIEDIYEAFTFDVRSLLRDQPSGGCGSLLLGDECEGN